MSKKELRRIIAGNKPQYPEETVYIIKDPTHCLLIWNEIVDRYNSLRARLADSKTISEIQNKAPYLIDLHQFIVDSRKESGLEGDILPYILTHCYFAVCMTTRYYSATDKPGSFRLKIILENTSNNKLCYIISDPFDYADMNKSSTTRFIQDPPKEAFWHIYKKAFADHTKRKVWES